jgi:putative flavoprotein involved in K+ transport
MNVDVAIVGAGQAGLSVSQQLTERGIEHLVLERHDIGESWRRRWDSFCLVTPNWSVKLPGYPYDGDDPDGFMPRDEIVAFLKRHAASFSAPVKTAVTVDKVETGDRFELTTSDGPVTARSLVLATGAFQKPRRPRGAELVPKDIYQIDLDGYRNPDGLPAGAVLIVGSGQSGCQIAEELHQAGRRVTLACGRAPWAPRRINDHDLVWWLMEAGFFDQFAKDLPPEARLLANILASGHDGGHDLHLRILKRMGVTLTGRFAAVEDGRISFASDLADSLAWGDARYEQLRSAFSELASRRGMPAPDMADPEPANVDMPASIDLTDIGSVLFTGGFRPDFTSWIPWPTAFDDHGFPKQTDGASDIVDGLYFVGLHFLRKRKSGLLCGVGEDAAVLAELIADRLGSA